MSDQPELFPPATEEVLPLEVDPAYDEIDQAYDDACTALYAKFDAERKRIWDAFDVAVEKVEAERDAEWLPVKKQYDKTHAEIEETYRVAREAKDGATKGEGK